MRVLLKAGVAALVMSAATVGVAHAQNNCPVTTTTSTGPNGEIITRREACGAVEITTTPGNRPPTTTTTTTTNRSNTTTTTTTGGNSSSTSSSTNSTSTSSTRSQPQSTMSIPDRSTTPTSPSHDSVFSSSPPPGAGGWNPASPPNPMAMQRPVARIVLYDNNNFRGRNIGITQNTPDLGRRRFSDLASAARSQGGVWELCSESNYNGTCVTTETDLVLGAAGVDNTIASVRLIRP